MALIMGELPIQEYFLSLSWLPWLVVAGALFVIWSILRSNRGAPKGRGADPADASETDASELRSLRKENRRLETESTNLSKMMLLLPEFTKQLNSTMRRDDIGPLLIGILERLFEPQQILVFYTDRKVNKLVLHAQKGFDSNSRRIQVGFGEGRIGWVAQHQTAMSTQDFINLIRSDGDSLNTNGDFRTKAELVVPMVHEDETLGVISMGGISQNLKHEKRFAKMIGDLGSIALYNSRIFMQLQEKSNSDGLTSLFNKKFFLDKLGNEIFQSERKHRPLSLFLFDLDHFKKLNDTHGHLTGDEVLKATGGILREQTRELEDVPARYGGEEFIVLLPNTRQDGALVVAEKIRKALATHTFTDEGGKPIREVTLSGGVSTFPEHGRTSTELIQAADAALYRAKQEGRNRVYPAETKYFSSDDQELDFQETRV
jgi:diguanylate cyclase (GGDEF)-like protein